MTYTSILIWTAAIAGALYGGWKLVEYINRIEVTEESVEGEVDFDDMVAYFKSQHLKKGVESCFIVSEKNDKFRKLICKEGYISLGLFIVNEKNEKIKGKVVHAKSFDAKTMDTLGENDMIKLS